MAQVPSNLIPTRITQLQDAPVASEDGLLIYVHEGKTYKIRAGDLLSVSGVPLTRQVLAGTSLQGGGPLSADVTLSVAPAGVSDTELSSTGVTPGAYGSATTTPALTVNSQGRITSVNAVTIAADMTSTTGVLPLEHGGTNKSIMPSPGSLLYLDSASMQATTVGLAGQVLVSSGAAAPIWGSALIQADQAANLVYAGPGSGPAAPTGFRTLVNADLPSSGVVAGTYGSATASAVITVDDKGLTTTVAASTITPAFSDVTGTPTTLAGYGISDAQPLDTDLTSIAGLLGTSGLLQKTGAGIWALDTTAYGTVASVGTSSPLTSTGGTSPSIGMVNQGTATTVLHGNASGNPSFGSVTAADAPALVPYTAPQDLQEWTGFLFPDTVVSAYDSVSRTVTVTSPVAGQLFYYWHGSKIALGDGTTWTSSAHNAVTGGWFLSSADGSTFTWAQLPWEFYQLMVAFVYYGTVDRFGLRETHGTMSWQSHQEFHETMGTYLHAGGDLTAYTLASTTAAARRPTVSSTMIKDEDIETINAVLSSGLYTKVYLTGAGVSTFTVETADIVPLLANNPYYNSFSTPNWTQALVPNNGYMIVWLVAVPTQADVTSQKYRYLWVQGQQTGTLAAMQAVNSSAVNVGTFAGIFTEFVFIGKIIIRYIGGNWQLTEVSKLTGTRISQSSVSGGYLSAVTTDTTLVGVGTGALPLGVNPASAVSGGTF